MIARIWRGVVPADKADAYLAYLERTGLRDYRATAGNLAVQVLQRIENGTAEFLLITVWESWEAIRRFAGPEPERARYYPEDTAYLLELDPHVRHYEVIQETV